MKFFKTLRTVHHNASVDLRKRLLRTLGFLSFFHAVVALFGVIIWQHYPSFLGLVILAYGLGLRHAVDIDHIAAIDNTTRKLMQEGKRPVAVGLFFSLGHATVVIILSLLAASSASLVKNNLQMINDIGPVIGMSISSLFLLVIGIINLIVFIDLFRTWKNIKTTKKQNKLPSIDASFDNRGLITRMIKPLLKMITKSWQMYFIGLLFGLGFDTASEVALLSIAAATGTSTIPFLFLLMLPLAFTASMVLVDTIDGILMLGAYGWAYVKPLRKLYYNMHITFISVIVALVIGTIEGLQVVTSHSNFQGTFFLFITNIELGLVGYTIIGICIASWLVSWMYTRKAQD